MSVASIEDTGIETYLEEQHYHGKSERTLDAYERVLRDFAEWAAEHGADELAEVDRRTCMSWVHDLRTDHRASTIATYASYVNRFYAYMNDIGELTGNPMALVVEQMDESIETDPVRRDIAVSDMRRFVTSIDHPLTHALVVTLLKTGMRVGECCNLDLRDLHLASAPTSFDLPAPRAALDGRPQAIFVDSEPSRGDTSNGERRSASNKRQRSTVIPVDDELVEALLPWLAIRPDPRQSSDPLFLDTRSAWGERLTPAQVRSRLEPHTRRMGWYESGGRRNENVTPHYFRHFFTTVLRDRIGDRGIVKYLRGDVADDVIETYTHNWGDRVRSRYLDHIYSLRSSR